MNTVRWILAGLSALLLAGALLSFGLFIAFDIQAWLTRARSLRRGVYLALLLWFNVEIWGRVIGAVIGA